jgi:hypothetical protein
MPADSGPSDLPDEASASVPSESGFRQESADDILAEQTVRIPGFAGMYVDDNGQLVLMGTDVSGNLMANPELQAIIDKTPSLRPLFRSGRSNLATARFTFAELNMWKNAVTRRLRDESVSFIDLDEVNNRITIGIQPGSSRAPAINLARSSGLPEDAIAIVEEPLPTPIQSLQDKIRPMDGGIEIGWTPPWSEGHYCTLGVPVEFGSPLRKGFITASHCSQVRWSLGTMASDTTNYTQQAFTQPGYSYVGREYLDPKPFVGGACPFAKACRYSDALLTYVFDSVASHRGYIALTTFAGTNSPGSITIGSIWGPETKIVGIQAPTMGVRADKMGRTSGWTYGPINRTCYNTAGGGGPSIHYNLCQYRSYGYADNGDSGSPVFYFGGTTSNMLGILWGRETSLGVNHMVWSPFSAVLSELAAASIQYTGLP